MDHLSQRVTSLKAISRAVTEEVRRCAGDTAFCEELIALVLLQLEPRICVEELRNVRAEHIVIESVMQA